MSSSGGAAIAGFISGHEEDVLKEWVAGQLTAPTSRAQLVNEDDIERESRDFLDVFAQGLQAGAGADIDAAEWAGVREYLSELSRRRVTRGFSSSETAAFVFSLKSALYGLIAASADGEAGTALGDALETSALLDKLGLFTVQEYQRGREEVIRRQQAELIELSTPVVQLWEGIVAVPLIGTLDSDRTQVVMENLLERIVETNSSIAVIDITGVPTVDTLVAQYLLKAVSATRLMGADCIICGIRPQIAQTIVQLGRRLRGRGDEVHAGRRDGERRSGDLGSRCKARRTEVWRSGFRSSRSASFCSSRFRSTCTTSSRCACRTI